MHDAVPLQAGLAEVRGEAMTRDTTTSELDRVNRGEWSQADVVRRFGAAGAGGRMDSWSDPGEQAAVSAIAPLVRNGPILDVGVGGGRTTRLLRLLSDDYVAVDYTQEMVDACRANFPGVDVRQADARDLADFDDGRFALVVFSYNGLDAVDHLGRAAALDEMARVLAPGGVLLYSTHNKDGPCYRATPLRPAGAPAAHAWSRSYRLGFAALRVMTAPIQLPRAVRNHRRLRRLAVDRGFWAIAPNEGHDFGLLVHYVTRAGVQREVSEAGLTVEAVLDAEYGNPLAPDDDVHGVRYFHVIGRKPVPSA